MNRNCEICKSKNKKYLYTKNFYGAEISLSSEYNVVKCNDCGFIFADNIMDQKKYDKYYAELSKYEFRDNDGYPSTEFVSHAKNVISFVSPYLKNKEINILDIGCSTGALLSEFKKRGYNNLYGVDPSPFCVEQVKKHFNIKADSRTISSMEVYEKKYDLIILSAVCEHLIDLYYSIEKIIKMLKDNGLIFIDVPNLSLFDKYIFVPFQQFNIEHINFFSLRSLMNLMNNFNFSLIEQKVHNVKRTSKIIEPDIFTIFKKSNYTEFIKDNNSEFSCLSYIKNCKNKEDEIKSKANFLLNKENNIVVWGVGQHSMWLFDDFFNINNVLYFVDSDYRYVGNKFKNKEIKSIDFIKSNETIFISSWAHQEEIRKKIIKELNLRNKIITLYE